MQGAFPHFHILKDDISLGQVGNKVKAKANELRIEHVKMQKSDKEINAETWTPSKNRHKMNAWWEHIIHEIDVSNELDANINIPRIHLMSDWVKYIRQYGVLQQHSAKSHEQAHEMNRQDGWNTSK